MMATDLHPVLAWPQGRDLLASRSRHPDTDFPLVLSLATPRTPVRHEARELARAALREALALLLDCPPQQVEFFSEPGRPLQLVAPQAGIGLSLSHEPGLSLAAVHRGAVGIDLLRVEPRPLAEWLPDWQDVARDYLGKATWQRIARTSPGRQAPLFAQEWTRLEACLKCRQMDLSEWSPQTEAALQACATAPLDLPEGWIGTVAILDEDS